MLYFYHSYIDVFSYNKKLQYKILPPPIKISGSITGYCWLMLFFMFMCLPLSLVLHAACCFCSPKQWCYVHVMLPPFIVLFPWKLLFWHKKVIITHESYDPAVLNYRWHIRQQLSVSGFVALKCSFSCHFTRFGRKITINWNLFRILRNITNTSIKIHIDSVKSFVGFRISLDFFSQPKRAKSQLKK